MKKDKKTVSDRLNFVCLKAIGQAEVVKDVDSRLVAEVLES
jgi:3-dehydroquinate synthetase